MLQNWWRLRFFSLDFFFSPVITSPLTIWAHLILACTCSESTIMFGKRAYFSLFLLMALSTMLPRSIEALRGGDESISALASDFPFFRRNFAPPAHTPRQTELRVAMKREEVLHAREMSGGDRFGPGVFERHLPLYGTTSPPPLLPLFPSLSRIPEIQPLTHILPSQIPMSMCSTRELEGISIPSLFSRISWHSLKHLYVISTQYLPFYLHQGRSCCLQPIPTSIDPTRNGPCLTFFFFFFFFSSSFPPRPLQVF